MGIVRKVVFSVASDITIRVDKMYIAGTGTTCARRSFPIGTEVASVCEAVAVVDGTSQLHVPHVVVARVRRAKLLNFARRNC